MSGLNLHGILEQSKKNPEIIDHADHNVSYWRAVHGGHALVRKYEYDFDPQRQYWFCTERRVLVAYFAKRFREAYAPADVLRSLAFKVFSHFETARGSGAFGPPELVSEGSWKHFSEIIRTVGESLPPLEEYQALRRVWRHLSADSLREDFLSYMGKAQEEPEPGAFEPPFFRRLSWFPYIELSRLIDLRDRQAFFYGYYQAFTSTNSYATGGSLSFAPILQNNRTGELVRYLDEWITGTTPRQTGFTIEGRSEVADRAHHMSVVELFGFLRLQDYPLYNSVSAPALRGLGSDSHQDVYDLLRTVGEETRSFLVENDRVIPELARQFMDRIVSAEEKYLLAMEGIRAAAVSKRMPEEIAKQVDVGLQEEMISSAKASAEALPTVEAANAYLHLLLDASLYLEKQQRLPIDTRAQVRDAIDEVDGGELSTIELPESLRSMSNDALGFLWSGYHVLLAGPPGTGKTTIAQFVGHAWNNSLTEVVELIDMEELPLTVVGNSSWAPFHTIGGILPDQENQWRTVKGIFIDPDHDGKGEWRLRPGCIVLDEMNRADLDRCIGDLYPLLSQSVASVHPTGLPGILSIRQSERFRVVATVNDATLDDIVFPMSEGLARRFLRLELHGATRMDLVDYIGEKDAAKATASLEVIDDLYERLADNDRLERTTVDEHLPFGVGYFKPIRSWVDGSLILSPAFAERDLRDQARELVRISLRSGARVRNLQWVLEVLEISGESG